MVYGFSVLTYFTVVVNLGCFEMPLSSKVIISSKRISLAQKLFFMIFPVKSLT